MKKTENREFTLNHTEVAQHTELNDKRQYRKRKTCRVKTVDNPFQYQNLFVSTDNAARGTISRRIFANVLMMVSFQLL